MFYDYFAADRCFQYCKDTNFKANHNTPRFHSLNFYDVSNIAKILILKQITTSCGVCIHVR